MNEQQSDAVLIRLVAVDPLFSTMRQPVGNGIDPADIEFDVSITMGMIIPDGNIIPLLFDAVVMEPGIYESPLARVSVQFNYGVEGISRYVRDGVYYLPLELIRLLLMTSYDTMRGVWISRTLGTIAEKYYLPIIKAEELFERFHLSETTNVRIAEEQPNIS